MSADTRPRPIDTFGSARRSFRDWRGRRPFWGGLWTLLSGVPIMYIPYQTMKIGDLSIRLSTTAGAGSLIIGVLLVVLGLTMWFQRQSRVFAGIAAILLAVVSLVVSNFGGFLLGFIPALLGGALAISWMPGKPLAAAAPDGGDADPRPPGGGGDPGSGPGLVNLVKETNGSHRAD